MTTALFFVLFPIGLYVPLFLIEIYRSIWRIGQRDSGAYIHATWEITHTLLIIGITNFVFLFSDAVVDVARAVYSGLLLVGFAFVLRAIVYLGVFFSQHSLRTTFWGIVLDNLFALSHVLLLSGLLFVVVRTAQIMTRGEYTANVAFLPFMWPGLILMIALAGIPAWQLYRKR